MSEMVERVANVIGDLAAVHGVIHNSAMCEVLARAAISAMDQPTEAMAHDACPYDLGPADMTYVWRLMIGEALK